MHFPRGCSAMLRSLCCFASHWFGVHAHYQSKTSYSEVLRRKRTQDRKNTPPPMHLRTIWGMVSCARNLRFRCPSWKPHGQTFERARDVVNGVWPFPCQPPAFDLQSRNRVAQVKHFGASPSTLSRKQIVSAENGSRRRAALRAWCELGFLTASRDTAAF